MSRASPAAHRLVPAFHQVQDPLQDPFLHLGCQPFQNGQSCPVNVGQLFPVEAAQATGGAAYSVLSVYGALLSVLQSRSLRGRAVNGVVVGRDIVGSVLG